MNAVRNLLYQTRNGDESVTDKKTRQQSDLECEQDETSGRVLASNSDGKTGRRPTPKEIEEMADRLLRGEPVYPRTDGR